MTKTEVLPNDVALADLAGRINTEHEAVCEAAMTATQHAIKCGNLLAEAKSGLPYGQWLPWLKENCELSERTTQAYMRLARRYEELGGEEAQRVADLPVRQAMVAIADHQAEQIPDILNRDEPASEEEIWAWATRQVNGPFNRFDFDSIGDGESGPNPIITKLLNQTGVPATASFCMSRGTKDIPMLRVISSEELQEALAKLAPVAKGNLAGLDIDWEDFGSLPPPAKNLHRFSSRQSKRNLPYDAAFVVGVLTLDAQWLCGGLLNEAEYRDKTYSDLPDDEYSKRYRSDCDEIIGAFQADCQRKLEELKRATAEGRYADI